MGTCKCRGSSNGAAQGCRRRNVGAGRSGLAPDRLDDGAHAARCTSVDGQRGRGAGAARLRRLARARASPARKQMAEAGAIAPPTPSCSRSTLGADRYSLEKQRVESDQACVVRSGRPADVARDARSSRNLPALRQRTTADGSGIGKSRRKRSTAALSPSIVILAERCASASGRSLQSTASSVPGSVSIVASA
jgi:hypothetical protein